MKKKCLSFQREMRGNARSLLFVLVRFLWLLQSTVIRNNLRGKSSFHLAALRLLREVKSVPSLREPGGRNRSRSHRRTRLPRLLNRLSPTIQDHLPRCGIIPSDIGPPTSIINQKLHHMLTCRPIWWENFFNPVPFSKWLYGSLTLWFINKWL